MFSGILNGPFQFKESHKELWWFEDLKFGTVYYGKAFHIIVQSEIYLFIE